MGCIIVYKRKPSAAVLTVFDKDGKSCHTTFAGMPLSSECFEALLCRPTVTDEDQCFPRLPPATVLDCGEHTLRHFALGLEIPPFQCAIQEDETVVPCGHPSCCSTASSFQLFGIPQQGRGSLQSFSSNLVFTHREQIAIRIRKAAAPFGVCTRHGELAHPGFTNPLN